jgi:hypothetical protein
MDRGSIGHIIFLNPFPKTLITGGIKTAYSHAEILAELGFKVIVFQPDGPPVWLPPRLQALSSQQLAPAAADILVFPEVLNDWLGQFARQPMTAKKVIFCQNQYYMFSYGILKTMRVSGSPNSSFPARLSKKLLEAFFD